MKKMILRVLTVNLLVLGLVACDGNTDEEKAAVRARLPEGCTIQYIGVYAGVRTVAVFCGDKKVTTTSTYRSSGKNSSYSEATVVIEE